MIARYGYVDADVYEFECTLDGEYVSNRATRGNDMDGWVDLFPVNEEGQITSIDPERCTGEVAFTSVKHRGSASRLAAAAIEEISELRHRVAGLETAFEILCENLGRERALQL